VVSNGGGAAEPVGSVIEIEGIDRCGGFVDLLGMITLGRGGFLGDVSVTDSLTDGVIGFPG